MKRTSLLARVFQCLTSWFLYHCHQEVCYGNECRLVDWCYESCLVLPCLCTTKTRFRFSFSCWWNVMSGDEKWFIWTQADLAHRTTITKMYDNVCDNNICNADGCIEWLLAWLLLCCGSCDLPDVISTPKKRQDDGGTDDWTRFTIWVIVLSWTVNAFW